jgi:error-prone DNA polymerase
MKVESPAEHMAAVLASGGGFYHPSVYLEEARRMGVKLYVPGVNSGHWLASPWNGGVMVGFHRLRGLGETCFRKLRDGRPYDSADQVLECGLGPAMLSRMAMAGCFHELGQTPAEVLLMIERFSGGGSLLSGLQAGVTRLPGYDRARRAGLELGLLGACVTESPLALIERPRSCVPAFDLPANGRARCWGIPATRRSLEDDSGFLMLQDNTGVVDAYLPQGVYRKAVVLARREAATLILEGRMIRQGRMDATGVEAGPLTPEPLVV